VTPWQPPTIPGFLIRLNRGEEEDPDPRAQDVFFEFVWAYRLIKPIEGVGAWLFRVVRNRIIDDRGLPTAYQEAGNR